MRSRPNRYRPLRLAPGARLERNPCDGLRMLRHPSGSVPLNDTAAEILALCDGRNTRRDVLARFKGSSLRCLRARHINAFIDAARKLAWITEDDSDVLTHQKAQPCS
jgi:hypothetical protein